MFVCIAWLKLLQHQTLSLQTHADESWPVAEDFARVVKILRLVSPQ